MLKPEAASLFYLAAFFLL